MTRADAAKLAALGLSKLASCPDGDGVPGNIDVGYCKQKGIFYHFFGLLGPVRKRNFDYADSPTVNEALNTVEVSTIDSALLLTGAAVAETYFTGSSSDEQSIRADAAALRDAADWRWAYSFERGQLSLGWQPTEAGIIPSDATAGHSCWRYAENSCRQPAVGYFASPADASGVCSLEKPALLDYFTDESLLPNLFAMAAPIDHRPPSRLWMNWDDCGASSCLSSSGSMFVYQFARLLGVNTSALTNNAGLNLGDSSCAVHASAMSATQANLELPAAHETPFQTYRANSIRETRATRFNPSHDHGIAPYAWAGSFVCPDTSVQDQAIAALRKLVATTPVYHPLMGLADVYYPDLASAAIVDETPDAPLPDGTRRSGMWVNYTSFGIDQGPIALGMNLALCQMDGGCSPRLATHPVITDALANAECHSTGWIEGEWGAVGDCHRTASNRDSRCAPKVCESGVGDNFPQRADLSGGLAAQIFHVGTALTFEGLRFAGPVTLTIYYSLGGFTPENAAQMALLACVDGTSGSDCAEIQNFEPTSDWDTAKTVTVGLAAAPATSCNKTHTLNLILEATPNPDWGIQIDRVLIEGQ